MPSAASLTIDPALSAAAREQVERLLDRAEAADGYLALNEAAVLALRQDASDTVHLTALTGDRVIGYAQLVPGPRTSTGFLVVDSVRPAAGRRTPADEGAARARAHPATAARARPTARPPRPSRPAPAWSPSARC